MRFERRKLDASIGAENLTKLRRRQLKKGVDAAFGKRRLTREPSHPTKTDADRRRGDGNDAGNKAGERKKLEFHQRPTPSGGKKEKGIDAAFGKRRRTREPPHPTSRRRLGAEVAGNDAGSRGPENRKNCRKRQYDG